MTERLVPPEMQPGAVIVPLHQELDNEQDYLRSQALGEIIDFTKNGGSLKEARTKDMAYDEICLMLEPPVYLSSYPFAGGSDTEQSDNTLVIVGSTAQLSAKTVAAQFNKQSQSSVGFLFPAEGLLINKNGIQTKLPVNYALSKVLNEELAVNAYDFANLHVPLWQLLRQRSAARRIQVLLRRTAESRTEPTSTSKPITSEVTDSYTWLALSGRQRRQHLKKLVKNGEQSKVQAIKDMTRILQAMHKSGIPEHQRGRITRNLNGLLSGKIHVSERPHRSATF